MHIKKPGPLSSPKCGYIGKFTDHLDRIIAVDWDVKPQTKQKLSSPLRADLTGLTDDQAGLSLR